MARGHRRGKRKGAYVAKREGNKGALISEAAAAPQGRVPVVEKPAAAIAAPRNRVPQLPKQLNISNEEQNRVLRNDLRRLAIIAAAMVALIFIVRSVV